jgi:hypothetical protein
MSKVKCTTIQGKVRNDVQGKVRNKMSKAKCTAIQGKVCNNVQGKVRNDAQGKESAQRCPRKVRKYSQGKVRE